MSAERNHAIVLGGSFAGLLAARVLAEHFDRVTILEKDARPVHRAPRPGVPQGRHIHIFLSAGVATLEALFPGATAELVRDGAQLFDYGQSRLYVYGKWLPRVATGLTALAQTRPFLEQHVREWMDRLTNVEVIYEASGEPLLDASRRRVIGAEVALAGKAGKQALAADLVIDARGRNPRLPRWLAQNGFGVVPELRVGLDLGYATGRFCVSKALLPDSPLMFIVGPPPRQKKVGVIFQAEDGIVFGGMGGYLGDHPSTDPKSFLEFARNLSQPDAYNVLSQGQLCSEIERFVIPAATRRHYRRMRNFPSGLIPIGDTVCSPDPAFGQGMTLAALEAKILAICLANNPYLDRALTEDYFRRVEPLIDIAWDLSTRENLKYPQVTGPRPWLLPVANQYVHFLVGAGDPQVMAEMYKVMSLAANPLIALRPTMAIRALRRTVRPTI